MNREEQVCRNCQGREVEDAHVEHAQSTLIWLPAKLIFAFAFLLVSATGFDGWRDQAKDKVSLILFLIAAYNHLLC